MSNLAVVGGIGAAVLLAYLFHAWTAERPLSVAIFADRECEDAQSQYYRARERAIAVKNENPAENDKEHHEAHDHADVCAQHRMAQAAELGLWLLTGTLLFTGGAMVAAWRTVRVMQDSAKHQLRAYVNFERAEIVGFPSAEFSIKVSFKNFGQTPARQMRDMLGIAVTGWPPPETLPPAADEWRAGPDLGPEGEITLIGRMNDMEMPDVSRKAIVSGRGTMIVYGTISYKDAFGDDRTTNFKLAYGGNAAVGAMKGFVVCPDGNNAT